MVQTRLGDANVKDTLPAHQADAALKELVATCQMLALQEWGHNRDHLLDRTGRLVKGPLLGKPKAHGEWTWARPRLRLGGPIGAHTNRYRLLACHPVILCGPGRVEGTAQAGKARRSLLPASIATVARWHDLDLDDELTAVNFHLTAQVDDAPHGAQTGRYRTNLPKRVHRHRDKERPALDQLVAKHLAKGRRVVAFGDSNFHHMPIKGLTGWWGLPAAAGIGTEGWRAIDCISVSWGRPDHVDVLTSKSDHRHPIATYREAKP